MGVILINQVGEISGLIVWFLGSFNVLELNFD